MKRIIHFSLNNKFAIWILTFIVVAAGLYSGFNMKQETMPNITLPNVSVFTVYPGAAPDEVADKVTVPIEERIQNLAGVELVTSNSLANMSSIQVEFNYDTDMKQAENDIKEALGNLTLPEGVNDPTVNRLSFNAFPVLSFSITDSKKSLKDLTKTVEDKVLPSLKGIEGVADVQISGQQLEKVNLTFDQKKLSQYGLTEDTVKQIIQGSNLTFPLGLTTFDKDVKNVVIDGTVSSVKALKELEIPAVPGQSASAGQNQAGPEAGGQGAGASGQQQSAAGGQPGADASGQQQSATGGQPGAVPSAGQPSAAPKLPTVKLGDIAKIETVGEVESISRTNGKESIGIQIVKTAEANTVSVVNKAKDQLKQFEKDYDIKATPIFDQGKPIEQSVSTMLDKALFGIIFAVIVILLFLRSFKTTIISVISIPLSLLIAMIILKQMDISLNILTLGALTVAIGRVIDDSIVVMENIYRRMGLPGEQLRGKALITEATRQMFIPIASSTVVTIAVFLPLGFVHGQIGELFMPFALAVVFALAASLLVAITIVPMLAHTLFKKKIYAEAADRTEHKEKRSLLATLYKRILNWTLDHKLITFGASVLLLVLSFFLVPHIGMTFMPEEEEKTIMAAYSPDPGVTKAEAEKAALDAEKLIGKRSGVKNYQFSQGGGSPESMMMGAGGGDNSALFFIEYDDDFKNFKGENTKLVDKLNENTKNGEWKTIDFTGGGSSGLNLFVYGDSIESIQKASDQILTVMDKNKNLEKVESSISEAYDQYTLVANEKKLSQYGLTAAQVGMQLSQAGEAPVLTTVKHNGKDTDVYIETKKKEYKTIKDLTNLDVPTPLGTTVKIKDVMDVKEGKSPDTIERRKGDMYASLTANATGKDIAGVSSTLEKDVDKLKLPDDVRVEFGGATEEMQEAFAQLGLAMLAAVGVVYFVLVVTFKGALAPFAILFSLPFIIIGSLVALWIANEPISVSSLIGALMLIGIVVTNAIVLIDRVIHNEDGGLPTRESLLEAGATRLRPILMTALATIGALIPLALGSEGSGLISKGLGVTVIGGLASSTILTLVIVPIVYEVIAKFRLKKLED